MNETDPDLCYDNPPTIFGSATSMVCIRKAGHGAPHRDESGCEWWPIGADHCDLLETAWGVIANAYGGNWDQADDVWRSAAERWRDRWHELLKQHCAK